MDFFLSLNFLVAKFSFLLQTHDDTVAVQVVISHVLLDSVGEEAMYHMAEYCLQYSVLRRDRVVLYPEAFYYLQFCVFLPAHHTSTVGEHLKAPTNCF